MVVNFASYADTPVSPARAIRAVTPSDSADLPDGPCKALFVLTDGDLEIVAESDADNEQVVIPVTAGTVVPVRVRRVMAANTDATVLALY